MIDEIDAQILTILQENARTPNTEIARRVGMAASAIYERVRKLEATEVIGGYTTIVNPASLNLGLLAFIFVRTTERVGSGITGRQLAALPAVLEVHDIAGEDCYLVKVRAANTEALGRFLREQVGPIPTVTATRTTIVLSTIKESARLPLPGAESGAADD
jgi:Lrp/AsnC family leucine-responsive transcriptional regulator